MEMTYRKVGRRYVPFEPFEGFPADGIWLVRCDGRSQRLTIRLDDLHKANLPLAIMLSPKYDDLVEYLIEAKINQKPSSVMAWEILALLIKPPSEPTT